jgi:hypothetical protein
MGKYKPEFSPPVKYKEMRKICEPKLEDEKNRRIKIIKKSRNNVVVNRKTLPSNHDDSSTQEVLQALGGPLDDSRQSLREEDVDEEENNGED